MVYAAPSVLCSDPVYIAGRALVILPLAFWMCVPVGFVVFMLKKRKELLKYAKQSSHPRAAAR